MSSQEGVFSHDRYLFRRKVFQLVGGVFHISDPYGRVVLYSEQKAFKLKEDIRIYSDERKTNELLTIKARQIVDFGATYDVVDPQTNSHVGALRRKGLKSMLRDEWLFLDPQGQEIGVIGEDRMILAILRRILGLVRLVSYLSCLFPQKYTVSMWGQPVASFKQHFNPFVLKYTLDLSQDYEKRFDRRLAIAAGILLCAIERRQA